jgi:HEAT repeat protein
MSSPSQPAKHSSPESLPNVEPPTAGFILQLFLIPLLIVSIVIVLWLVFSWLAHSGQSDAKVVLKDLQQLGSNSFQRAHELAGLLQEQSEEGEKRRNDPQFAAEVGKAILHDIEVYPGEITDSHGKVRLFLCGALGEFEVPEAALPLVKVLEHTGLERSSGGAPELFHPDAKHKEITSVINNVQVRMAAAESLAKLADHIGSEKIRAIPEVVPSLIAASRRDSATDEADVAAAAAREKESSQAKSTYRPHAELRSVCAFALGVIGGEEALDRLHQMAENDPYPNARYNAATGLARYGDERVIPTLLEMLDPNNPAPPANEWHQAEKEQALVNVLKAGLQATLRLAETNPQADLRELRPAIERLKGKEVAQVKFKVVKDQGGQEVVEEHPLSSNSVKLIQLSATETARLIEQAQKAQ